VLQHKPFLSQSTALRIAKTDIVSPNEVDYVLAVEGPQNASGTPAKPFMLGAKARKIGSEWKLEPN
jgi:hypothetical protein